jgi:hypothetical protein
LRQLTPAQKRELKLAMDMEPGTSGQKPWDEKTVAQLVESLDGLEGQRHDGFVSRLLSHLDKVFPGCVGHIEDNEDDQTMRDRDDEGAEDDDDELYTPAAQFLKAHSAQDQPPPFEGTPEPRGRFRSFDDDFPEARRIGMDNYPAGMNGNTSVPRSKLNALALDTRLAKRVNNTLGGADDFAAMFPEATRIGIQ